MSNDTLAVLENNETGYQETPGHMESLAVKAAFFFCYAVIFLLGGTSNVVMLVVGIRQQILHQKTNQSARSGKDAGQEMTFSVTNLLVTNLAAADIFLCAFSLFFTPISFYLDEWPFGEFGCKFLPSTSIVSVCVISFTSTTIAVDRLLAICYPHSPRLTVRSALVSLVILWFVSAGCSLPIVLHSATEYNEELMMLRCSEIWSSDWHRKIYSAGILIVQFFVPAIIISCCYVKIGIQLKTRSLQHRGSSKYKAAQLLSASQRKNLSNSFRVNLSAFTELQKTLRIVRILAAMVVIFMFCWLPINALLLIADVSEENVWQSTAWYAPAYFIGHLIAMSCTLWNPLLYGWMNGKLRLKIIETLFPSKKRHTILTPLKEITHCNRQVIERLLLQDQPANGLMQQTSNSLDNNMITVVVEEEENYENSGF